MSNIKTYDTYIEIPNGLFRDPKKEKNTITKNDLKEVLKFVFNTNNPSNREVTFFTNEEGIRQFNRAMQEELYIQLSDHEPEDTIRNEIEIMSEEETIQYFDRISQEEN